MASLRSINITEEQLKAAKKCLQLSLHEQMLCPSSKFETLGSSILYGAKDGLTCSQVADACSGVTLSDVKVSRQCEMTEFLRKCSCLFIHFLFMSTGRCKEIGKRKVFNGSRR